MNNIIIEQLNKEGVKCTISGYKYLVKCIAFIVEDWERACNIWALYEKLADEYNMTSRAVDKAIRYVLKVSNVKLTPSEFICRMADNVRISLNVSRETSR